VAERSGRDGESAVFAAAVMVRYACHVLATILRGDEPGSDPGAPRLRTLDAGVAVRGDL
jgi:hypothetical protein